MPWGPVQRRQLMDKRALSLRIGVTPPPCPWAGEAPKSARWVRVTEVGEGKFNNGDPQWYQMQRRNHNARGLSNLLKKKKTKHV